MASHEILIAGAGIAGLTAALAFARRGQNVTIFEKAPELTEVGAGLQLSPNATRILCELGLGGSLEQVAHRPQEILLASGRTMMPLARVPLGPFAESRWHAPYYVIHRGDLQSILLEAVNSTPLCRLELGTTIPLGSMQKPGALLVGADGVWSRLRSSVPGAPKPGFTGQVAWRFLVEASEFSGPIDPANVSAFLGPASHLVAYPVRGGTQFNMVAITRGRDLGQTWDAANPAGGRTHLAKSFQNWHPTLKRILEKAEDARLWPIHAVPDGAFSDGNSIALIGDAAHAMAPFAAQGAAMAIEDAWELAASGVGELLGNERKAALNSWEQSRRKRTVRARNRAAFNQFAYHARGPIRLGRDLVLSFRTPESLAADFDWLYGWQATGLTR